MEPRKKQRTPRVKADSKSSPTPKITRITAEQRKDWRNLPSAQWNTLSFHAFFADMNREKFGVESYVPMRNYGFEQRQLKAAIERYGADVLREVCEQAFADYRPTREYPQLNAGFVLSFTASRILPKILADREARVRREQTGVGAPSTDELIALL